MVLTSVAAGYCLEDRDFEHFKPGRNKNELLEAIEWRGNLEMAAELDGLPITAISYGIFGGPFVDDPRASIIWAVFADNRFVKFVRWPNWGVEPRHLGDFGILQQAFESEPLDIRELRAEKIDQQPSRQSYDYGLTLAWQLVGQGAMAAHERDMRANAAVRRQYSALRIALGMTEADVQSTFDAQPLAEGSLGSKVCRVFGSAKSFDMLPYLHYSNTLILFDNGRVVGIYSGSSIPGGIDWSDHLHKHFVDVPF